MSDELLITFLKCAKVNKFSFFYLYFCASAKEVEYYVSSFEKIGWKKLGGKCTQLCFDVSKIAEFYSIMLV